MIDRDSKATLLAGESLTAPLEMTPATLAINQNTEDRPIHSNYPKRLRAKWLTDWTLRKRQEVSSCERSVSC